MKVRDIVANSFNTVHKNQHIDHLLLHTTFVKHYKNLDLYDCDSQSEAMASIDYCYQVFNDTIDKLWATTQLEFNAGDEFDYEKIIEFGKTVDTDYGKVDTFTNGKKEETTYGKVDTLTNGRKEETTYGKVDTYANGRKTETTYGKVDTMTDSSSVTTTTPDRISTDSSNTYDNGTMRDDKRNTVHDDGSTVVQNGGNKTDTLSGKDSTQLSGNDVSTLSGTDTVEEGGIQKERVHGHKRPLTVELEEERRLAIWNFYDTVARLFSTELVITVW